jgi:hypothetical protein
MTDREAEQPATDVGGTRSFGYVAGWLPLVTGIVIALLVETVAVHLLVSQIAGPIAFFLSALSIATAGWLVADAWAARSRPIVVTPTEIRIRVGMRWQVDLPRRLIRSVETPVGRVAVGSRTRLNVAMDGQPNVEIALTEQVMVRGPLGQGRMVNRLAVGVDDPRAFRAAIDPG